MAEFTAGKPLVATTGRQIDTTDEFTLAGSYDAGSELIENGDFDGNADGWTLNDASSYSAGKVTVLYASSDDPVITQPVSLVSGTVYLLMFMITNSNDGVQIYFDNNTPSSQLLMGDGLKAFVFTADNSGSDNLYIDTAHYVNSNGWTIDDISLKAITEIKQALIISDGLDRRIIELGGDYSGNLAIGVGALENNTGQNNVAIGEGAGSQITSGKRNIVIGAGAQVPSATVNDQVAIGSRIRVNGDGVRFDGSTPTTILLPATPTAAQIATALELLGLVVLS